VTDVRHPIGKYPLPESLDATARGEALAGLAAAPAALRAAVRGLDDGQLDAPYRPGGWTVRQVVHHVPDSHLNAYLRMKLGLTEAEPTIRPYQEALWAELPDSAGPIEVSLDLLEALHHRWVYLLQRVRSDEFARTVHHPEMGVLRIDQLLGVYDWHGRHHTAQVTGLRQRMGW
jgi:uncharacterized damage-inducible protein DinB